MRKSYKYRLFTTRAQEQALDVQLGEACRLYNAALQERRDAYQYSGLSLNYYDQANQLKAIRSTGDLGLANYSACQDVLRRVEKTFNAFFRRVKAGIEKPGFPRFKSRKRFDSYTFPSYGDGCRLTGTRLYLQGVGHVKVKLHRPVDGVIKTITVKRACGKWYVCFSVEIEIAPLPVTDTSTGIDVGLTAFATLADGTEIANPRYYRRAQAKLRLCQRRVARRKRGSKNRRKAVLLLQKAHAKVKNQRADFQHKVARTLVNTYGMIAVEDLNIKGLASGMLAKSVLDAGWGSFLDKISYKAAEAGRVLVESFAGGTSQECLCGAAVPKTLGMRWHLCVSCGLSAPRDHVSAQLIERRGLRLLGLK
jgi:putative transposase